MAKSKDEGKAEKKADGKKKSEGQKGGAKAQAAKAQALADVAAEPKRVPRLKTFYEKETAGHLSKEFKFANVQQVPRMTKIVLNMGLGEAVQNPKIMDGAADELATIAGQKPVITKAKKSIATYKLREGMPIGCMVTLRRERMWEFFDRLVNVALPRVRDFRGVSPKGFDGKGNFSMGIKEQIIFPEIDYDKIDRVRGLDVAITTTAETDDEARALLKKLGMPFRES